MKYIKYNNRIYLVDNEKSYTFDDLLMAIKQGASTSIINNIIKNIPEPERKQALKFIKKSNFLNAPIQKTNIFYK